MNKYLEKILLSAVLIAMSMSIILFFIFLNSCFSEIVWQYLIVSLLLLFIGFIVGIFVTNYKEEN